MCESKFFIAHKRIMWDEHQAESLGDYDDIVKPMSQTQLGTQSVTIS